VSKPVKVISPEASSVLPPTYYPFQVKLPFSSEESTPLLKIIVGTVNESLLKVTLAIFIYYL
jgi:hypothetical protein